MSTGVDLSQFYALIFNEAVELRTEMEQLLLSLDTDDPSMDDLNGILRAAHAIKGGACTFGCFGHLADTTHLLENVLDYLRNGELALRKDMIDLFLEAKDVLTEQLAAYRNADQPDEQAYERICQQLRELALEKQGADPVDAGQQDVPSGEASSAHAQAEEHPAAPDPAAPRN